MEGQHAKEVQEIRQGSEKSNRLAGVDLLELLYRIAAHWKMVIGMALVFAILSGVITLFFITPVYQATSTIYVLSRKDSAINMADLQIGTALTSDYIKIFKIWEVQEAVIENLNLPYSYSELQGMLSVVNTSDTRMLDITVRSAKPEEAALIANEFAQVARDYISATMSTEKPNIVSHARVPSNPVSPNKTMNIMIGFILGLLISVAIVTVQMVMDDKYKTADDILNATGISTLAVVPINDLARDNAGKKVRKTK